MGKLNVRNGTPLGSEHLCKSCSYGQFVSGYRESEVMVFCTNTSPNFRVLFPIHECSAYYDKHKPDFNEMKKLAIDIEPVRVSKKTRGFVAPEILKPQKPEYEAAEAEDEEFEKVDAVAEFLAP